MVKLSYATTNPKAVMIKLTHALVAIFAVSTSIRLLDVTNIAKTFLWQFKWFNVAKTFYCIRNCIRVFQHFSSFFINIRIISFIICKFDSTFFDCSHLDHALQVRSHRKTYLHSVKTFYILLVFFCLLINHTHCIDLISFFFQGLRSFGKFHISWIISCCQKVPNCSQMYYNVIY